MGQIDSEKSLEQLDGQVWSEPTFNSHVVTECHRLRQIPLREFTVEDLRLMLGQNIGLEYLIPLALERLRINPLAEGAYYPGDLLEAVRRADGQFWVRHPELKGELSAIDEALQTSFSEYDCFRLRKLLPDESVPVGTIGVVLMVFNGSLPEYEVEFPDGRGGNLGSQTTYTITGEFMEAVKG